MMLIDELLQKPYWIIDILPEQVPADSPGQFFAVEKYFLGKERLDAVPDDTHMTVFDPDEKTLSLIRTLAAGEGLFVWQPLQ